MAKFSEWVGRVFRLTDPQPFITLFGNETYTGKSVTPNNALTLSTVWACQRLLAETLGTMPWRIVKKGKAPDGTATREEDDEHELTGVLASPNRVMTPAVWKECMMLNLTSWGNAYAEIETNSVGMVIAMNPLLAERMQVVQLSDGSLTYHYHTDKGVLIFPAKKILHIKLFSFGGLVGLSPIAHAANSIGLALAAEEYGARFFGQGAVPQAFLTYPGLLTPDQRKELQAKFDDFHMGLERSHKLAILEANMQYVRVSIPPNEAQFLQTRDFQVPEICRWYLVQPHKIMDLSRSTNNNIEHQDLEFRQNMLPYVVKIEEAMARSLLPAGQLRTHQVKFNMDVMVRADMTTRKDYLTGMVAGGIMDRNEARAKEDMNYREGAGELTVQSNMISLDDLGKVAQGATTRQQAARMPQPMQQPKKGQEA